MENSNDILNELADLSATVAAIKKINVFTVPEGYFENLGADIILGIKLENGICTDTAVNLSADVPSGYFDSLAGSILAKIKTQEEDNAITEIKTLSPVLSGLQSQNIFEVPNGYFDTLTDSILNKTNTIDVEDAVTELRALSPMLYSIQNENLFEVPDGYFENLSEDVLQKVKPQTKVVKMQRRSTTFLKYAVAAAFTGVMALGVFKFTGSVDDKVLPDYVTAGMKINDLDGELAKISDADIVKFLEATGTDVKAALVANSIDNNELPSQEDYLLDDQALDKYLNSINLDDLKN